MVQSKSDAGQVYYTIEDGIFGQVSLHLSERFCLAFYAPCYRGKLFSNLKFMGDTSAAQAILEGTYKFPNNTDPATRLLMEEASCIYKNMSQKQIATYVTGLIPSRVSSHYNLSRLLGSRYGLRYSLGRLLGSMNSQVE